MLNVVKTLFLMSLQGTFLVIFILLIKLILRERLNIKFHYYIWFLLIIKLIIPYGPESNFSIFNIFNSVVNIKAAGAEHVFKINKNNFNISGVKQVEPIKNTGITEKSKNTINSNSIPEPDKKIDYEFIFICIWILGIVIMSIFVLCGIIKIRLIKKSSTYQQSSNINKILDDCLDIMAIKEKVNLVYTYKINNPCIYGFIKPSIFIPMKILESISEDEFKYVLLHELSHFKRKDTLVNWILIILNIIYWYNPVIWYGFYKMRQDCEVACDNCAIKYLEYGENIKYGSAIIKLIQLTNESQILIGTTSIVSSKSEIKKRIIMISKYEKVSWKGILFGVIVIIAVGIVGLTSSSLKVSALDNHKITFTNKTLEKALREKINKPEGDILKSDVLKIDELNLSYKEKGLKSLEGIENFTNLKSLNLTFSYVADISPLKNLTKLHYLNLSRNYFILDKDISSLKNLVNLERLDLSSDGIEDLTSLKNMKNLRVLNLYSNEITDLNPIKDLDHLKEINLSGGSRDGYNHIKDISVLKNFKALHNLNISFNEITKSAIDDLERTLPDCSVKYKQLGELDYPSSITCQGWTGDEKYWNDNTEDNSFYAEFNPFNGIDIREIAYGREPYTIKINSNIVSGKFTIRVYYDGKKLFEKENPEDEIVNILSASKGVYIESVGEGAKGSFKFQLD
ncbi:M56 family metallopeptidase [Clostridium sp.]|uniref:M56 family metallopeptidase n=1 Tax=Clostridium sp. TaxID=1506 RepID=UPI002FDCAB2E